jgi:hypothetical protein
MNINYIHEIFTQKKTCMKLIKTPGNDLALITAEPDI